MYKFIGLFRIVILRLFPSSVTSYQDTLAGAHFPALFF